MLHGLRSVRGAATRHALNSFPIARRPATHPRRSWPITFTTTSSSSLRNLHTQPAVRQQFTPLVPPDPASLPKPRIRNPARRRKWGRRLAYTSALIGAGYLVDRYYLDSSLMRSLRTFQTGLFIGLDYKINFRPNPWFVESLTELHRRNAERVFNLLRENGGLYLKIGQAIAMQSAILPPEFQKMFSKMFDDAPQDSWADVQKVIKEDFGKSVEEVFGVSFTGEEGKGIMERTARASASVAQVHWARLPDGREVAIKVQKREIKNQVGWDLWSFKVVARIYSWWFDIPMYTLVPYITERLMLETDFENEAQNSRDMKRLVDSEPRLRNRVYIPKVFPEFTTKRVMTAEWIEGVRLWDKEGITNTWRGPRGQGSPGSNGKQLDPPSADVSTSVATNDPLKEQLKPDRSVIWKGKNGKGGLGVSLKEVMTTMVDLFSAQMFLWGLVHCDPHPGNIFVRRRPNGQPEVVLIDHGLYINMSPSFKHQYALFWKSLLAFDNNTISDIVTSWGVNNPDIFASATLMRPYSGGDQSTANEIRNGVKGKDQAERAYEMQMKMRAGIKQILGDESKWPRELIFIGRNLRIVQGNNQFLGSPVNRIKITGLWASRGLVEDRNLPLTERWRNWFRHCTFRLVLFTSDVVFWYISFKQWVGVGKGMEDEIEDRMKTMAKDMGVELNHGIFEG